MQALSHLRRIDGARDLHTADGIAGHKISRGDVHFFLFAASKAEDARMLEVAAHNAGHVDVLCLSRHAGQQTADAAHDHLDLHARARRLGELGDDVRVGQGVEFEQDIALGAELDLFIHHKQNLVFKPVRRDQQPLIAALQVAQRHVFKERCGVGADGLGCGDERDVGILRGGLFVVVSGTDLRDVAHHAAVVAGDEADLGVDLVVLKAVDDLAAGFLQPLGPVDVVLLVKARAQLDEHRHVLAVFRRRAQVLHELGFSRQPVNRDADADYVRRVCRLADHLQKRLHRLIRI